MQIELSKTLQVDPREPWVERHNREVREVWETHKADRPIRVPVVFSGARTIYLEENRIDYRTYYEDPDQMMRLQLEWARREREIPLGDTILGELPECWDIAVDFHPVATAASLGCPVVFRADAVPAHQCAHLSRTQCDEMSMPDMMQSGPLPRHRAFGDHFDRLCRDDLTFLGRPVRRTRPTLPSLGGGVFSTALDARGPDIMADMYDDPVFVHRFLERIAVWQINLHRVWHALDQIPYPMDRPGETEISITDHGIDMLSARTYDEFITPLIRALAQKYGQKPGTALHHCGRGVHLFPLIKERFGLDTIHALTWPTNDVARVRRELGYGVRIVAVIADSILRTTPAAVSAAVKDLLGPEVMGTGRLSIWVPGEVMGIPVENYRALYEAVRVHGRY